MPKLFLRLLCAVWISTLAQSGVYAGPLCPGIPAQAKSEGRWPISEEAFSEKAAKRELKKLNGLLGAEGLMAESLAWETSFVIIEGWYLKRQALVARKHGNDEIFVSDFCDFMEKRAYVRH